LIDRSFGTTLSEMEAALFRLVRRVRLIWYFSCRLLSANIIASAVAAGLFSSMGALGGGAGTVERALTAWIAFGVTLGFGAAVVLHVRRRAGEFHIYRSHGLRPSVCVVGAYVVHGALFIGCAAVLSRFF